MKFYAKAERTTSLIMGIGLLFVAIFTPMLLLKIMFFVPSILALLAAVFTLKPRIVFLNEEIIIKNNFTKIVISSNGLVEIQREGKSGVKITYNGKFPKMIALVGGFSDTDLETIFTKLVDLQKLKPTSV